MSLASCSKCYDIIDTDADPDSTYAEENYGIKGFLCEYCREIEDVQRENRNKPE